MNLNAPAPHGKVKHCPRELSRLAHSQRLLEASMGMATINSLLEIDGDSCIELNTAELILEKGKQKRMPKASPGARRGGQNILRGR